MSFNSELKKIIGKRISHVITSENTDTGYPSKQVFIVFDDNTYIEFFGNDINNAKNLINLGYDEALSYVKLFGGDVKSWQSCNTTSNITDMDLA